jgi:hypothetical protein
MNADRLVRVQDVGRGRGSQALQIQLRYQERFAALECGARVALRIHVLWPRHVRAYAFDGGLIADASFEWQVDPDGGQHSVVA